MAKKKMKNIKNRNILLFGLLLVALFLRLVRINQSFWLDEAIGALAAKNYTYLQIVKDFMLFDNHPPLYYLILKVWTEFFGYSEVAIRMPSVIFGVGTVYLTYLIAEKIVKKNRFFSGLSTLLIATSQFHIYYSQEARMYSATAFFASLAFYFLLKTFEDSSRRNWIFFSLAQVSLIFIDYVPVFFIPVLWMIAFLKKPHNKWWFNFLLAQIPIVILGFLWLPTLFVQAEKGKWLVTNWPAWKQVAGGANLKQLSLIWTKFSLGRISLNDKLIYFLLIGISSIPFILSFFRAVVKRSSEINLVWLWLITPITLGYFASFWIPSFIYFRFTYLIPAFYLLISWGIVNLKNKGFKFAIAASIVAVNFLGYFIYISDEKQQREQWRNATTYIEKRAKSSDVVIFEFPEPFAPYEWYSKGSVEAVGVTDSISAGKQGTANKTDDTVRAKEGVYYFEYLSELSDPQDIVRQRLGNLGFKEVEVYNFSGVGFIYYWRMIR